MTKPRVIVLRSDGTNCDRETKFAFEKVGARADIVHLNSSKIGILGAKAVFWFNVFSKKKIKTIRSRTVLCNNHAIQGYNRHDRFRTFKR